MAIQPYLFFEGRADEAIEFYKNALGAEVVMLMRYKDGPPGACPDGTVPPADKVMHATLKIGDAIVLLSDGQSSGKPNFQGFGLSLECRTPADVERTFNALLAGGGSVTMPVSKTFFSPAFGMVFDRFGIHWMVIVPQHMA